MPDITGFSHLGLTVPDLGAATTFWTEVMGFRLVADQPGFRLLVHPSSLVPLGIRDHDGTASGAFDETRPGLDHLALAVADPAVLATWADHLAAHGVPYSPVEESDLGHHLNFRAPDGIAVELFVLKPEVAEVLAASLADPAGGGQAP